MSLSSVVTRPSELTSRPAQMSAGGGGVGDESGRGGGGVGDESGRGGGGVGGDTEPQPRARSRERSVWSQVMKRSAT